MLFGSVRKPTIRDVMTAIELPRRPVNLAMDEAAATRHGREFCRKHVFAVRHERL